VVEANKPAQAFWRKVITAYTEGQFEETVRASAEWTGPVFSFDNRALAL
jgi:predicted acetyltransferase